MQANTIEVTIIQGEDKLIEIRLEDEEGDAYDLTNVSEITMAVKLANNSILEKKMTLGSVVVLTPLINGRLTVNLTDADTTGMKIGKNDFEIVVDEGTKRSIVQFIGKIEVKKRII